MITLEQLLLETRRALASEKSPDAELVETAVLAGRVEHGVDAAIEALRRSFPDRGPTLAAALRARVAHASLVAFQEHYGKTQRRRTNVEAPLQNTHAYVGLLFAYGYARALDRERAHGLLDAAARAFPPDDPLHASLLMRFRVRIAEALGDAADRAEMEEAHRSLEHFVRYKHDRARQMSKILEPREPLDPVTTFQRRSRRETVEPVRFHPRPEPFESHDLAALLEVARTIERGEQASMYERLDAVHDLAQALRKRPASDAIRIVLVAMPALATTTDSWNTNSHLCISVLGFVDAIVLGLLGEPAHLSVDPA